jgi:hypothetical protein
MSAHLRRALLDRVKRAYAKTRALTRPRTFAFRGYNIPIDLINLTGAGPESFEAIANAHIEHLERAIGLNPDHFVLEIGCGIGRDAIPLTSILSPRGSLHRGRYHQTLN